MTQNSAPDIRGWLSQQEAARVYGMIEPSTDFKSVL